MQAVVAEEEDETDDDFDAINQVISGDDCKKAVTGGFYNLVSFDELKVFQFDLKWKETSNKIMNYTTQYSSVKYFRL